MVVVGLVMALAGCSSDDDAVADETVASETAMSETAPTVPVATSTDPPAPVTTSPTSSPGSSSPTSPSPAGTETSDPVTPDGFDLVRATVTTADGEVCDLCLWVASTARERSRGLMGVTDLGDGDGMAFVYGAPHTGSFWMKNTPLPLSIAFFDDRGRYVDAFDMEPCAAEPCPLYPTAPDFLVAIEAEQGGLAELGIADGSRLDLTDLPCD